MTSFVDQPCADLVSAACGVGHADISGDVVYCSKLQGHHGDHLGRGERGGRSWTHGWPQSERPTKDNSPCCVARRDALGRLPIGYCSPDCVRRPR